MLISLVINFIDATYLIPGLLYPFCIVQKK